MIWPFSLFHRKRTFDAVVLMDERNRNFPVSAALRPGKKPVTKDWKVPINLDQKREGMCVGAAVSHEIASDPVQNPGIDFIFARSLYKAAQRVDEFPGNSYSGTSIEAGMKMGKKLGYYGEYRWAFSIDDLKMALASLGPAVLGVQWLTGMQTPNRKGFIRPTGKVNGGHAILCCGYNAEEDYFTLHNSWGKRWGKAGKCYISALDLAWLLKRQRNGVAAIPLDRKDPKAI